MQVITNISSVFLKSSTDGHLLYGFQLKVKYFSILHFYAETSGNDNKTIYPHNKTRLLPANNRSLSTRIWHLMVTGVTHKFLNWIGKKTFCCFLSF